MEYVNPAQQWNDTVFIGATALITCDFSTSAQDGHPSPRLGRYVPDRITLWVGDYKFISLVDHTYFTIIDEISPYGGDRINFSFSSVENLFGFPAFIDAHVSVKDPNYLVSDTLSILPADFVNHSFGSGGHDIALGGGGDGIYLAVIDIESAIILESASFSLLVSFSPLGLVIMKRRLTKR